MLAPADRDAWPELPLPAWQDAVRLSPDPDRTLLTFFESTFQAAARLGHWP